MDDAPLTRLEWIERKLRHAIVEGELLPGEKLNTEALAQKWKVSPTPLRECYQRLAVEGLIDLIPQRGARVAGISMREAHEIYDVRLQLEPHALRLSLTRRDEEWEGAVRAAFSPLQEVLETSDDVLRWEEAHHAFDEALLARCDNSWLLKVIRMLRVHSTRYRVLAIGQKGGPVELLHVHEELFRACLGPDVDEAVRVFRAHIKSTIDSFARVWGSGIVKLDGLAEGAAPGGRARL